MKLSQYIDEIPRCLTTCTVLDCLFFLYSQVQLSLKYRENMESQATAKVQIIHIVSLTNLLRVHGGVVFTLLHTIDSIQFKVPIITDPKSVHTAQVLQVKKSLTGAR